MTGLSFLNEIVEGRIDDLAKVVSPLHQDKFCRRLRTEFRKIDGNVAVCSEWKWRCFKAMRSLLFSALLFAEGLRARSSKFPEAMCCYALYYSLFHTSFSALCMHPQIRTNQLLRISHSQLLNLVEDKFVKTKILPKSYTELLEKVRVMRELTSYFAPLGGLTNSSAPDISNVDFTFEQSKQYLVYSFQLCNLMGSIFWKQKEDCASKNRQTCEAEFKIRKEEIGDHIEELVNYQPFPSARYWSFIGEGNFDENDARTAVRKFGLYDICPVPLLQYMTLEVGTEEIKIENNEIFEEFFKFIRDIW